MQMNDDAHDNALAVGIVQTTLNAERAWQSKAKSPTMSAIEDERAWQEICKAMRAFQDNDLAPQLIILPELSLPRTRLDDFEHLVGALNMITIAGVDYRLDRSKKLARNEGIVFVPRGFFQDRPSRYCTRIIFGKTYGAPKEVGKLQQLRPSWSFQGDHNVYIFDCEQYGRFGVSICYDFMDIERALMYRGKIEHLFVIAYNQDLEMFRSLANALSRTVFCNVVICNTGHYGGSLAVSPYWLAYARTIYAHDGANLFTTQVVKLPVRELISARHGAPKYTVKSQKQQDFKNPPPGMPSDSKHQILRRKNVHLK
jgi:predicted amidohydrolase